MKDLLLQLSTSGITGEKAKKKERLFVHRFSQISPIRFFMITNGTNLQSRIGRMGKIKDMDSRFRGNDKEEAGMTKRDQE
jgi:hypothetical protein